MKTISSHSPERLTKEKILWERTVSPQQTAFAIRTKKKPLDHLPQGSDGEAFLLTAFLVFTETSLSTFARGLCLFEKRLTGEMGQL